MSMRGIEAEYNLTIDERNEIMSEPFVVKIKTKTADLTGAALDWAVAECEGWQPERLSDERGEYWWLFKDGEGKNPKHYHPSTNWAQGGPIIEREGVSVCPDEIAPWCAFFDKGEAACVLYTGSTPLIAAMRCYVASKLGDEVNVPEEFK